jgi:acyl-coenzyme A thioesterase PaaI-like protein
LISFLDQILLQHLFQWAQSLFAFPPPVFDTMKGEIISFDIKKGIFKNKFPVLKEYLNPYGNMQGGIISTAIDNTIGPLSMLVSKPNFTRYMQVKYGKVIPPELEFIYVTAKFIEQKKRQLFFEAIVENSKGEKLASAKSTNWIID